jgi:hypothetical protein
LEGPKEKLDSTAISQVTRVRVHGLGFCVVRVEGLGFCLIVLADACMLADTVGYIQTGKGF